MPTLDMLASAGLKYNRFHTTALCSPTRTALLTAHKLVKVTFEQKGTPGSAERSMTCQPFFGVKND